MRLRGKRVIAASALYLCPVDLECCGRAECLGAWCADSGEPRLTPCSECGTLIAVRRSTLCPGCLDQALAGIAED
jgi:hypothetical protein